MALIPKIRLCLANNCTDLTFYELTGVYNAITNIGGYGSPNKELNQIVSANLSIVSPDNTTYNIDMTNYNFPSSNIDFNTIIDLSLLSRTSIEDGYWQFIYTLVDNVSTTHVVTMGYYFYCNIECCVSKLLNKIALNDSLSSKLEINKINEYTKAKVFLESLKNAANCFNTANFNVIKSYLNKICSNSGCKTCN